MAKKSFEMEGYTSDPWFMGIKKGIDITKREHYDQIHSTQMVARERVEHIIRENTNADQWLLITAESQNKGIGQYGKIWFSPYGCNIYATFIIPWPKNQKQKLLNITQVATISVAEVIEKLGFYPQIKWINDLLIRKKKFCGILCDHHTSGKNGAYDWICLGVGMNLNMSEEDGIGLKQPFTSLFIESRKQWDKESMLLHLQEQIFDNLRTFIKGDFNLFQEKLWKRVLFANERIVVETQETTYTGILKAITKEGAMVLVTDVGWKEKIIFNGRIVRT